jgi:microcystin-dependent protein
MADKRRNLGIPSGVVFPFAGATAPYGYLICDGRPVLQSEYPSLFLSVGFSHGDGSQNSDGTASGFTSATHFNLPDYRGRFLIGVDGLAGNDPDKLTRSASRAGGNTGDNVGSVQDDENKPHDHFTIVNTATQSRTDVTNLNSLAERGLKDASSYDWYYLMGSTATPNIGKSSSSTGPESRPKNVNVNYIIKV